jgi:hypothetical protein
MQKALKSAIQLAACLLLMTGALAQAQNADPTGTWKWSITGQNNQTRETTLKLKKEGDKLTGTISGRQNEIQIEEAKIKGDEISFQVTREFNANKVTTKYTGKISGDTIKGTAETARGERTRSQEWEAKREKK